MNVRDPAPPQGARAGAAGMQGWPQGHKELEVSAGFVRSASFKTPKAGQRRWAVRTGTYSCRRPDLAPSTSLGQVTPSITPAPRESDASDLHKLLHTYIHTPLPLPYTYTCN